MAQVTSVPCAVLAHGCGTGQGEPLRSTQHCWRLVWVHSSGDEAGAVSPCETASCSNTVWAVLLETGCFSAPCISLKT